MWDGSAERKGKFLSENEPEKNRFPCLSVAISLSSLHDIFPKTFRMLQASCFINIYCQEVGGRQLVLWRCFISREE